MDHFIRHRGGRFAGPEGDQSGAGHGEGAGYAVGEGGGQVGQRHGRRTRRRHFGAGGDAGAVGDLRARGFFADVRESAGGLRSAERAVAPDSDAAPVAPAARFFRRQAGDGPAEDRTADEVHQIVQPEDDVRFLQESPTELELLFNELLISGTSFFRDWPGWDVLAEKSLPELIGALPEHAPIRGWVPACATGEEAYPIAILRPEGRVWMQRRNDGEECGTDLDAWAIAMARAGKYPEVIAADVPAEWLACHFTPQNHHDVINRETRSLVVFAPQNLIFEPPLTRLDWISCRNRLIYLKAGRQKRLLHVAHYSPEAQRTPIFGRFGNDRRTQRSVPAPGPAMDAVPARKNGRRAQPGVVRGRHRDRGGPAGWVGAGGCDKGGADPASRRAGAARPLWRIRLTGWSSRSRTSRA